MTSIVERYYRTTEEDCTVELWYSTTSSLGTVYFRFDDGGRAHEQLSSIFDKQRKGLTCFEAQRILDDCYGCWYEVRK